MKKIIAFSFLAWAIAAISSPRPVKAGLIALPELLDVTKVLVSSKFRENQTTVFCDEGNVYFSFQQVMGIHGAGPWVHSDTVYNPARKVAVLQGFQNCETEDGVPVYIYELFDWVRE